MLPMKTSLNLYAQPRSDGSGALNGKGYIDPVRAMLEADLGLDKLERDQSASEEQRVLEGDLDEESKMREMG